MRLGLTRTLTCSELCGESFASASSFTEFSLGGGGGGKAERSRERREGWMEGERGREKQREREQESAKDASSNSEEMVIPISCMAISHVPVC